MKIIKKWNNLTAKKKILIVVLTLLVFSVILYFSETDRGRLARAYWLKNPLLCNFIWDNEIKTRCTAVLTADFSMCNKIGADDYYYFCLYDVSIKKEDPAACDEAKKLTVDRCLTHIPEIQAKYQETQEGYNGYHRRYLYNESNFRKHCD
ncbi:MAG: hypothetical protein WAX07_00350 [Candidatus Altiarchaeia archaeon]